MKKPIKIDLADLTEEHLKEALPHIGKCQYGAPCIIGTLMPKTRRKEFDDPIGGVSIDALIEEGTVVLPNGQAELAIKLQEAFDKKSPNFKRTFASVVKKAQKLKEKAG